MTNPWDRQPRQAVALPEDAELPCPICAETTDSLKQYRYISWAVFYGVGATWQTAYYRGCPSCMRSLIARRAAWNLIPANVLWLILLLPWGLGLFVASYRKGHSQPVLQHITPELAAAREMAANEVSWARVWVIIAILICWLPLLGIPFVILAYLMNRKAADWKRPASVVALAVNAVVHVAIAILIAINAK